MTIPSYSTRAKDMRLSGDCVSYHYRIIGRYVNFANRLISYVLSLLEINCLSVIRTLQKRCISSVMRTFLSSRVINMWNNLPVSSTNFSSLSSFRKTVPNTYLINFCRVNFT